MWYHIAAAVMGYLLAAMFSANVAVMATATVWASAWTWVVLMFWWLIGYFVLVPIIVVAAVALGGTLLAMFVAVGLAVDRYNR